MAKFYSIILPGMDASPEVVCFLLKANVTLSEDLTIPLHAATLPIAALVFQVKSTPRLGPERYQPCSPYGSQLWVIDLCVCVWTPTFASVVMVQALLCTTFKYLGDTNIQETAILWRKFLHFFFFLNKQETEINIISLWFFILLHARKRSPKG